MEKKSWGQKSGTVRNYVDKIGKSRAILFLNFDGMDANFMSKLRSDIKALDGEILVGKNTLFYRAFMNTAISDHRDVLIGPTALVFAYKDPVLIAKKVYEYTKELNKDNPIEKIKGGLIQGRFLKPVDVQTLAELPPAEVLISKLMGTIQAPLMNFMMVLKGIPQKLVLTLKAIEEKKS
ncbi:MAG: 50S ribosomal protein L10 [Aquificaceae bacterium]